VRFTALVVIKPLSGPSMMIVPVTRELISLLA
jgi:hypothetical protein